MITWIWRSLFRRILLRILFIIVVAGILQDFVTGDSGRGNNESFWIAVGILFIPLVVGRVIGTLRGRHVGSPES